MLRKVASNSGPVEMEFCSWPPVESTDRMQDGDVQGDCSGDHLHLALGSGR